MLLRVYNTKECSTTDSTMVILGHKVSHLACFENKVVCGEPFSYLTSQDCHIGHVCSFNIRCVSYKSLWRNNNSMIIEPTFWNEEYLMQSPLPALHMCSTQVCIHMSHTHNTRAHRSHVLLNTLHHIAQLLCNAAALYVLLIRHCALLGIISAWHCR